MSSRSRRYRSRSPVRHRPEPAPSRHVEPVARIRKPSPDMRNFSKEIQLKEGIRPHEDLRKHSRRERSRSRGRMIDSKTRGRRSRSLGRRSRSFDRRREDVHFEPPHDDFLAPPRRRSIEHRSPLRSRKNKEDEHFKFSPPVTPRFQSDFEVNPHLPSDTWGISPLQRNFEGPLENENFPGSKNFMSSNMTFRETQEFPIEMLSSTAINNSQEKSNSEDPNSPTIPEFNPETSRLSSYEWIKLIEDTAKLRDWKKDEKHYVLSSRLAGFARQWYLTTGIKNKTWGELRMAFFKAFPSEMEFCNLLRNMLARVKEEDESMTSYFQHKVALLNACEIHGRKAVSCIISGLENNKLRLQAKSQNCGDPDALYIYLRSEETEIPKKKPKVEQQKTKTKLHCFFCKKSGHLIGQCLQLKLHRCSVCFKYGHECQQYQSEESEFPSNNMVMHGSLAQKPVNSKCFMDVFINGISLNGYIDQSSDCTTIREMNAYFLKMPVRKQYKVITGFCGSPVSSVGTMDTAISVDRAIANVRIYIVPDHIQQVPVIVGRSFIEQSHVVVVKEADHIRFYQRMDNGKTNFDF